jgi:hypothetical protein
MFSKIFGVSLCVLWHELKLVAEERFLNNGTRVESQEIDGGIGTKDVRAEILRIWSFNRRCS